jgi:hypothetical protein
MLAAAFALAFLAGCASPGPPLPPSLKLPEIVTDLAASRAGDTVTLRWTTPSRTTDKLLIAGLVVAEICRAPVSLPPAQPAPPAAGAKPGVAAPCAPVVAHVSVVPGESEAIDPLPTSLASGAPQLLAYRVQLRNAAGRTAGASAAVFTVSGAAPEAIEDLRARATKPGVVLEWRPVSARQDTGADAVELERTWLDATAAASGSSAPKNDLGLIAPPKEPAESRLRVEAVGAGAGDPGGTIDRGAQIGRTYRYSAQRVRTVVLGGQTLEVRSLPSSSVTVALRDVFPPEPPAGLVAVPGFADAGDGTRKPTIDLSWEPNAEPRLAGYRLYRRELDGTTPEVWRQLGSELVTAPAYRDLSAIAGQRYAYRVTAVSDVGEESAPSGEVEESAPTQ